MAILVWGRVGRGAWAGPVGRGRGRGLWGEGLEGAVEVRVSPSLMALLPQLRRELPAEQH